MKALSPCCPVPTGTGSVRMYPPPTLSPGDFVASCGTRGKEAATKRPQLGAFCLFPSFLPSPVAAKGEGGCAVPGQLAVPTATMPMESCRKAKKEKLKAGFGVNPPSPCTRGMLGAGGRVLGTWGVLYVDTGTAQG